MNHPRQNHAIIQISRNHILSQNQLLISILQHPSVFIPKWIEPTPAFPSSKAATQSDQFEIMSMLQHMHQQQEAYWRYAKIRDNSIRGAFRKLTRNLFDFVSEFPDFVFGPWTPTSDTK